VSSETLAAPTRNRADGCDIRHEVQRKAGQRYQDPAYAAPYVWVDNTCFPSLHMHAPTKQLEDELLPMPIGQRRVLGGEVKPKSIYLVPFCTENGRYVVAQIARGRGSRMAHNDTGIAGTPAYFTGIQHAAAQLCAEMGGRRVVLCNVGKTVDVSHVHSRNGFLGGALSKCVRHRDNQATRCGCAIGYIRRVFSGWKFEGVSLCKAPKRP
jgi:hypothetical protein